MIEAARATWPEAEAAAARGALAMLPIGATEQHGPHLPLTTDTDLATGVARALAEATGAFLLPAIPYGDAWSCESFPGTISASPETLRALVTDIGRGVRRMGLPALITLNGHFGNREPVALAARTLLSEGLPVLHLDYPGLEALAARHCVSAPAAAGFYHADEVETAMMLALRPEAVRMDQARPDYPAFPPDFGTQPMQLREISASGVFGDPRPATAETGRDLIAGIVANCLPLVAAFRARHDL
ncbi:MAG: creatininase family protein [Rubellimicrobium sp.]|nr:creatininase family protein [Rubellimicrobium sp.]